MSFMASYSTLALAVTAALSRRTGLGMKDVSWYPDDQKCGSCVNYPDMENKFPDATTAIQYLLEEGVTIWVIDNHYHLPVDVFTYDKFNTIFGTV